METGQTARGFRLITAAMIIGGLLGPMPSAVRAGSTGNGTHIIKVGDTAFEFVRIPAGRFLMGAASGSRDEKPVHEVNITDEFYLGRTEVTVRQFRVFVEATGYKTDAEQLGWANTCPLPGLHPHQRGLEWRRPGLEQSDDHPAVVLSWNDATAFCRWLSERTGHAVRLPTEAQWEYAARAGRRDDGLGNGNDAAWYDANAGAGTHPVGGKPANPWGLCDMQGNAWEWCLDVWRPDYNGAAIDGGARMYDPTIPQAVWRYVLRGGDWASPEDELRYGRRQRRIGQFASQATGFRIALDPKGTTGNSAATSSRSSVILDTNGTCPRERGQGTLAFNEQTKGTSLEIHGVRFEFVRIPAGEFLMGIEEGSIEKPVHQVRIGYDFEMARTEVTVGQFRAFVEATGYMTDGEKAGTGGARRGDQDWQAESDVDWQNTTFPQSDDDPVTFISWYDAMAFCHWLSTESGREIRLPSEAEWEHACRAGTTGAYAGEVNAMGWHRYNSGVRTHPVAQKQPNAWGLYDMHGNVWEWCLDFFTTSYEGAPTDGSPRWNVDRVSDVVSRGGSFINPPGWLASPIRMGSFPDCSHYNNGFRLVRVLKKEEAVARSKTSGSAGANVRANGLNHYIEVETYGRPRN